jgi:CHAT domain-containing protein
VVLSACEAGLGDIKGSEGVYGLQRAFKMAGDDLLVMSLWKVPDSETAEFMEEFYRQMLLHKPIDDAFELAQATMKNKYRSSPQKWAAWLLVH